MHPRERLESAHLYAITPDADPTRVVELARAVVAGGADAVQLRHKTLARGRLLELARELRKVTAGAGALLIVNDHLDVALLAEADGVHLGEDDLSVASARRLAPPGFLVGASAGNPDAARAAVAAGADHLGSGPVFATPIKSAKQPIGPAGVAAVQQAVGVPVFAIGGVDVENIGELRAAGVRRACMIRALGAAADPEAVARAARAALAS